MRDDAPLISFFVPCLNEERNVQGALDAIVEAAGPSGHTYEILVVDDCSTDGTVASVEAYRRAHPEIPVQLIRCEVHRGLGYNFANTARTARGRYYMLVNGDNVERPDAIAALLAKLGAFDIVIPYFGKRDTRPWIRQLISRVFARIVNVLSGTRVQYYNGPVIHLRENVIAHHPGTPGFGHQAELIVRLIRGGATYCDVEVPSADRKHGHTNAFKWRNWLSVSASLWRIALSRFAGTRRP